MFDGLAGQWTPVQESRLLTTTPREYRVAREPVLLRRDEDGNVSATLTGVAAALPTIERAGFVWIFTDLDAGLHAPPALDGLDAQVVSGVADISVETWAAPWNVVLERLLFEPHRLLLPDAVARWRLQRWLRATQIDDVATVRGEAGDAVQWTVRSERGAARMRWARPNGFVYEVGIGGDEATSVHAWCVPRDPACTRVLVASVNESARTLPVEAPYSVLLGAPSDGLVRQFHRWFARYGARSSSPLRFAALG